MGLPRGARSRDRRRAPGALGLPAVAGDQPFRVALVSSARVPKGPDTGSSFRAMLRETAGGAQRGTTVPVVLAPRYPPQRGMMAGRVRSTPASSPSSNNEAPGRAI